ncbi:MAG: rod shape-determining protein MreC [Rubrivivax sp.]|nr:rod shape-determining protein MreC [Rubrivivax sp.]
MPLGTLDRTPPPFFRQGPSALTKLVFFSALALFLMVADGRFKLIEPLRAGLAVVLLPIQRTLAVPVSLWQSGGDYLGGLDQALQTARRADQRLAAQADKTARVDQLRIENERLRALLELRPAIASRSLAAEVLYEAADPFSRKVFVDRGRTQGVAPGAPVINDAGVLGQVTRLYPLTAEVTLLVDKDAAIPVLNTRTQQRSVAFGGLQLPTGDAMELRFLPANADVKAGDALVTSGIDGVYPPGLPVARVAAVERRAESGFARILLEPAARADGVRHVLLVEPVGLQLPPRPADEPAAAGAAAASAPTPRGARR